MADNQIKPLNSNEKDETVPVLPMIKPITKKSNIQRSQSTKSKDNSSNPYSHISSCYSHEATTVPPYVLYGIANSDDVDNSKQQKLGATVQDPFLNSLNNNWGTFFKTVDTTPAFSEGILKNDIEAFNKLPDLSGKWGGDARLKSFLNNDHTDLKEYEKKMLQKQNNDDSSASSEYTRDYTKSRSKAGYWMSMSKKEQWIPYFRRILLANNYLPLFFRILTMILSIIALSISCHIYRLSRGNLTAVATINGTEFVVEISQATSTIMSICLHSIALIYLFYITYDEFYSKPIGIRNPVEKIRLILLDLLFIIFSSANLALSFDSLSDSNWVCKGITENISKFDIICENQRALVGFLFLILAMWVITFTISILRVIQKVSGPSS